MARDLELLAQSDYFIGALRCQGSEVRSHAVCLCAATRPLQGHAAPAAKDLELLVHSGYFVGAPAPRTCRSKLWSSGCCLVSSDILRIKL